MRPIKVLFLTVAGLLSLNLAAGFVRYKVTESANQLRQQATLVAPVSASSGSSPGTASVARELTVKGWVEHLSAGATRHSLQIVSVAVTPEGRGGSGPYLAQMNVAFKGSYASHKQWLSEQLMQHPSLALTNLMLNSVDGATGQVNMVAKLVLFQR